MDANGLRVVFDKLCYCPGEMLTDKVQFVINSAINIRAVKLEVTGMAECSWIETHERSVGPFPRRYETKYVPRRSIEIYINSKQALVEENGKNMKLSAGEYSYPFAVRLPYKISSSFTSCKGVISYYAMAIIDTPFSSDYKRRATFTVINPLNLNLYPNLKAPRRNEGNKFFGWFCTSGSLTMAVDLPKAAFATSECVPILLQIDNANNITIYEVHISLKRKIMWTADGYVKSKTAVLQNLHADGINRGQSHTRTEYLTINSIECPNLEGCSIIGINYKLYIEAKTSGLHTNLRLKIPIIIGDIPFSGDPSE